MFNHGIIEVRDTLKANDNPPAEYNVNLLTAFSVVIRDEHPTYEDSLEGVQSDKLVQETLANLNQLKPELKQHVISLIIILKGGSCSVLDIQLKPELKPAFEGKTRTYLSKILLAPAMQLGLIEKTIPSKPKHPQQKYQLTELGKIILSHIEKE